VEDTISDILANVIHPAVNKAIVAAIIHADVSWGNAGVFVLFRQFIVVAFKFLYTKEKYHDSPKLVQE